MNTNNHEFRKGIITFWETVLNDMTTLYRSLFYALKKNSMKFIIGIVGVDSSKERLVIQKENKFMLVHKYTYFIAKKFTS